MAVVGLKQDDNDKEFYDLAVLVSMYEAGTYSFKNGGDEYPIPGYDYFRVYTFNREYVNILKILFTEICDYMPGECGDKLDSCKYSSRCKETKITEDEIDWDVHFVLTMTSSGN